MLDWEDHELVFAAGCWAGEEGPAAGGGAGQDQGAADHHHPTAGGEREGSARLRARGKEIILRPGYVDTLYQVSSLNRRVQSLEGDLETCEDKLLLATQKLDKVKKELVDTLAQFSTVVLMLQDSDFLEI